MKISMLPCFISPMNPLTLSALQMGASGNMPPMGFSTETHSLAQSAMRYIDKSPDPFHAVQTSIEMLKDADFTEIKDYVPFKDQIKRGRGYYFTRNKSTLISFTVGNKFEPGNGFKIIGGHTDSPCLKIKPRSKKSSAGCIQLAVECYGGGLWHTWFDRDLGISGRVLVRSADGKKTEQKLIKIDRALLRIPNLAIHLQTAKEREAFQINKEEHLIPILSREVKKALSGVENKDEDLSDGWTEYQEPILMQIVASDLNIDVKNIMDFELNLFDVQGASFGGAFSEFIYSARLDNLASCFMAVQSLVDYYTSEENELEEDEDISLIAMFDHEEVGSSSATGAGSPIMKESVERISNAFAEQDSVDTTAASIARSFVLSVDQAHAMHPNYASKHEKNHQPKMNHGMVIKRNSNQRYATTGITGFIIREIARKAGLPHIQEFIVRNDCACGSTIGPIISAATGIRAIDMGCPQMSMHSIRESMGTSDFSNGLELFKAFFKYFREVDSSIVD